ncbi:helix-turn-helix domain-containing protein [Pseudarthrobacter sp. NamE2]|uniref:helix-turn-helix domain-containing protein n=1 Tax=Pseudarthrobacter sp. NamE2 TaxID=2576838 RepID=UPI0010FF34A4|nr:helix-turn-helix domain-containing protein [Pseudarthrobacter sp. NamE2]TLM83987.1 helix-turn-helix domain-containing protein [Pseudarthrobacter sp. NamE2]
MALIAPRMTGALPPEDAASLQRALAGSEDVTVFVDGTVHRLPPLARDAVVDLLARFSRGEAVTVSSVEEMLTTSKAAELAGISHTYLRNMTDRGEIPVEYRGTHRRIPLAAIMAWLEKQKAEQQKLEQQKKEARKKGGSAEDPDPEG